MKFLRDKDGTTIMELIVVVIIMATLAMVFTPSYFSYLARTRVKTAIREIITLKKSLDSMATVCGGYPIRISPSDSAEFYPILDIYECGASSDPLNRAPKIWPKENICTSTSLSSELLQSSKSVAGIVTASGLCNSSCTLGDQTCYHRMGNNFQDAFVTVTGQKCSPVFGSFTPGWNYSLLTGNARDKPVGVICGIALGYKTQVKIVVNTSGFYNTKKVADGTGVLDIDGTPLSPACLCGPYCEDLTSGKPGGCCSSCWGQKGIGYSY
jgi:type II secretory pathway pseudopilin PulG